MPRIAGEISARPVRNSTFALMLRKWKESWGKWIFIINGDFQQ
jgi:hypothetical protein